MPKPQVRAVSVKQAAAELRDALDKAYAELGWEDSLHWVGHPYYEDFYSWLSRAAEVEFADFREFAEEKAEKARQAQSAANAAPPVGSKKPISLAEVFEVEKKF